MAAPSTRPLGQEILSMPSIQNNGEVLNYNRIFVSLIAGCLAGIAGVTGYLGFGVYLAAHIVLSLALVLKAGFQPKRYFGGWAPVLTGGIFSSSELLTFILFWTLSNNLVYLF